MILILELLLRTGARKKKKKRKKTTEMLRVNSTSVMAVPAEVVSDFKKTDSGNNNKDASISMNKEEDMGLRNNIGEQLVKVYGEVMILGGKTSKEKIFNLPYNLNSRFL
jgi:carbamoylphosphate synthase small subunit